MQLNSLNKIKYILIFCTLLLSGCGESTRKKMGIVNTPPDEFQVYKQKALSVPPNYELRAPGSINSESESEEDNLLFGENEEEELTINDEILLMSVNENETDINIRELIDDDNALKEVDKSTLDKILDFEPIIERKQKENVLNAAEEKKRLEELKSEIKQLESTVENIEEKKEQGFEQTTLHSIATENDRRNMPEEEKKVSNDEDSLLDKILDFSIFGSDEDEEEEEVKNQRDTTFFNKDKDESE